MITPNIGIRLHCSVVLSVGVDFVAIVVVGVDWNVVNSPMKFKLETVF